jgi:DeoR family transcriptional regulator of aga operon
MSVFYARRAERLVAIMDELAMGRALYVRTLAARFGVSAATVRRDLQSLEEQKLLRRTHGGAAAEEVAYELPFRYRGGRRRDAKQRIAEVVVRLLPKGLLTVGLTGGTTTTEVARGIATRLDLTVVTNALNIATDLAIRPRIKTIVTGGVTRTQSYELVGPLAERTLRDLNIQVAVVGVDGIDPVGGLTTHDQVEARTNAAMIAQSQRTIVVADGSKVGRIMLAQICPLSAVTELVTDTAADPATLAELREAGLQIHVAQAD